MYHTIGIWVASPTEKISDIFSEKARTYTPPNGNLFSVTRKDDGTVEIIREWVTLEDANDWVSWTEAQSDEPGLTSITIVEVPE